MYFLYMLAYLSGATIYLRKNMQRAEFDTANGKQASNYKKLFKQGTNIAIFQ